MAFDLTEYADAINAALAEGRPCVIATADSERRPNIGLKGSILVLDKHRLAYWERAARRHLSNLRDSPEVSVLYYNPERSLQLRFYGRATLYEDGPTRDGVMERVVPAELERDPERKGIAVVIDVESMVDSQKRTLDRGD